MRLAVVAMAVLLGAGSIAQTMRDPQPYPGRWPAQSGPTTLTWIPGSTVKVEQIIGDIDWADCAKGIYTPTASQTVTRFNVLGNGLGYTFEDNGKLIYLCGDTIGLNVNYHAKDAFAWSASTDPTKGLVLNFFTNADGTPQFVEPPGVKMGADDVPNSGISLAAGTYIICNTGSDMSLTSPHVADYSILAKFDEATQTFTTGRTISSLNPKLDPTSPLQGRFIIDALHSSGSDVMMFGLSEYRASNVYLADIPVASFESGAGTRYFTGLSNGVPTWSTTESDSVPVVQDNPLNGPPTIGNVSVTYSTDLGLWLMTYDGGRQKSKTTGVYFCYATQAYGPWSTPQLIFNKSRDNGLGVFIHDPTVLPDPPGDGLGGPTIGTTNDIYTTPGGEFAPEMIERFTRVSGNTLTIYFALSTWNPYTVVRMRSQFTIGSGP